MSAPRPICSCGKRSYSSENAARRASGPAGNSVRIYRGPGSSRWHVTNRDRDKDHQRGPKPTSRQARAKRRAEHRAARRTQRRRDENTRKEVP